MITRVLYPEEKVQYNKLIKHPVQTWEWGDFQTTQGHKVYRLGIFDNEKMVGAYSVSFHKLPKVDYSIGTLLRGPNVDQQMLDTIQNLAKQEKAIFIKIEPDVYQKTFDSNNQPQSFNIDMHFPNLHASPKVAFYPFSYVVDLAKTEDELLSVMHPKTRYNIKVANRFNVKIEQNTTDSGFEIYLKLLFDTTKRQGFYLHSENYHRELWQTLKSHKKVHIMIASLDSQPLAAFMLFVQGDKLFYPYGASLDVHREAMAPTLLMWEVIKFGRSLGLKSFDMWGSLGPNAKETEPGYGFHRFKQGYGGQLVQFVGTYDFVISPQLYKIYNLVDKYRWKYLRLKAKVPFLK
ncbi:peptidoglycan bridge formation glycyltransferase FemA/FemB family protein [Candidatus Shapirobacteria bacterium]|nr:peptidoglycan bridge formation glycyltransferase FemA/FemB family protein [Candidatus Shapirobacteria bacterium]